MSIDELEQKLNLWRRTKKSHKDRIPKEYWREAAILARKSSASSVATKLNLNITDLRKKMGLPAASKKKVIFKELPINAPGKTPVFEITTASGITLKVYQ